MASIVAGFVSYHYFPFYINSAFCNAMTTWQAFLSSRYYHPRLSFPRHRIRHENNNHKKYNNVKRVNKDNYLMIFRGDTESKLILYHIWLWGVKDMMISDRAAVKSTCMPNNIARWFSVSEGADLLIFAHMFCCSRITSAFVACLASVHILLPLSLLTSTKHSASVISI